jgi:DNA-binding NarL/FixJ family response regulator
MSRNLNVFILNDDASSAGKLRKYLKHRFGNILNISLFFSSASCLRMIDNNVDLVVVDDYLNGISNSGRPGVEILKHIKQHHPQTEVVILTSNEDIGLKVEALKSGARDVIPNKRGAFHQVRLLIDKSISQPIRYLVAEYGVRTFVFVFFLVWLLLGLVTWVALRFWRADLASL